MSTPPITPELLTGFRDRVAHTVAYEAHRLRCAPHQVPDNTICRAVADVSHLYPSLSVELIADTLTRVLGAGWGATYAHYIHRRSVKAA